MAQSGLIGWVSASWRRRKILSAALAMTILSTPCFGALKNSPAPKKNAVTANSVPDCKAPTPGLKQIGGSTVFVGLGMFFVGAISGGSVSSNPLAGLFLWTGLAGVLGGAGMIATGLYQESREHSCFEEKTGTPHPESSRAQRTKKKFSIHRVFLNDAVAGTDGYSLGWFLSGQSLLEIDILNRGGQSTKGERIQFNSRQTGGRLLWHRFTGNSFHYGLGIQERIVSIQGHTIVSLPSRSVQVYDSAYRDFGVLGQIGNRFQWENISLGFQWFSLYVPIVTSMSHHQEGSAESFGKTDEDIRKTFKSKKAYATGSIGFYSGISF